MIYSSLKRKTKRRMVEDLNAAGGWAIVYGGSWRRHWRIQIGDQDYLRNDPSPRAPFGLPLEFDSPGEAEMFLAALAGRKA